MTNREISLDVLRGLAIVGMVLSGTISRNPDLPAWLFHAQIAPPDFSFNSSLPEITWVDLVFPFFLFAMGMAFPFALNKSLEQGMSYKKIIGKIISRSIKLFFFAFFLAHLSPFHYPQELGWIRYLLGLIAFIGFFLAYAKFPRFSKHEKKLNVFGYVILFALIVFRVVKFNLPWSIHSHDIIILVLANMALFGAIIWLFTRNNWYIRLGIMAIYFAFRLTYPIDESVNKAIWDFTLFKWVGETFPGLNNFLQFWGLDLNRTIFYHPNFIKYLLIVIPGTIAGDLIYKGIREKTSYDKTWVGARFFLIPLLLLANLSLNLWGLLSRHIEFVWIMNIATALILAWFMKKEPLRNLKHLRLLMTWSIFWLLLGLVFEAYEGGIKKDHATMSYFFITSGLSGFMIIFFKMLEPVFRPGKIFGFLTQTGMNPLLGYVAAAFCIMPLLYFIQVLPWMDQWHTHWAWAGVLRGVILTTLAIGVTVFSVKKKYFWKM